MWVKGRIFINYSANILTQIIHIRCEDIHIFNYLHKYHTYQNHNPFGIRILVLCVMGTDRTPLILTILFPFSLCRTGVKKCKMYWLNMFLVGISNILTMKIILWRPPLRLLGKLCFRYLFLSTFTRDFRGSARHRCVMQFLVSLVSLI